jgi:hypothetical protein
VESDTRMKRLIRSYTGGLAEVKDHPLNDEGQSTTVQFIHQSVNDFISKDRFNCLGVSSGEDMVGKGHYRLSRSCINYLKLTDTRREIGAMGLLHMNRFESRHFVQKAPFADYASIHCFIHAEEAERVGIKQADLIAQFEWPSYDLFQDWVLCYRFINPYSKMCPLPEATLLQTAAAFNLQSTIRELLQRNVNVEEMDSQGNRAIHQAARHGCQPTLTMLLDARADPGARNNSQETALSLAATSGHTEIVEFLIKIGQDVNNPTGSGGSLLQEAAENGKTSVVYVLILSGAEVNTQGGRYGNALQGAAWRSSLKVVQLLLDHGAEVKTQGGEYSDEPTSGFMSWTQSQDPEAAD